MTNSTIGTVLHNLRFSLRRGAEADLTDSELVESYVTRREEAAFEALLRRHGPMVLGVCRRLLSNDADADDAFQATFLVLVSKAETIRPRSMVGNWLYGVARATALKARTLIGNRLAKEREAATQRTVAEPSESSEWLGELLDRELRVLPDKYRAAIVLCDLEGKTIKEAAQQLGCPLGTVGTRLSRGRSMLARRFTRHGLALTGGLIAAVVSESARAAIVRPKLAAATVKAARLLAAGQAASGAVGAGVALLVQKVSKAMSLQRLKLWPVLLLVTCLSGVGTLLLARQVQAQAKERSHFAVQKMLQTPTQPRRSARVGWRTIATLTGHASPIKSISFGLDDLLLTGDEAGQTRLWCTQRGKGLRYWVNQEKVRWLNNGPDARWVAIGAKKYLVPGWDESVPVEWCVREGKFVYVGKLYGMSPDDYEKLRNGNGVECNRLIKLRNGNSVQYDRFGSLGRGHDVHGFDCAPLAISGDARHLALRQGKSCVRLSELVGTGEQRVMLLKEHQGTVLTAAFSADNEMLATAGADKSVRLWNSLGGEIAVLNGHTDAVLAVTFSEDGRRLASAGKDGTVRLWDVKSGKLDATLRGHKGAVHCVAFEPNGKRLISGGEDGMVIVWNVATGRRLTVLNDHSGAVLAVRFSRDGDRAASAGQDKKVKVWEVGK